MPHTPSRKYCPHKQKHVQCHTHLAWVLGCDSQCDVVRLCVGWKCDHDAVGFVGCAGDGLPVVLCDQAQPLQLDGHVAWVADLDVHLT